MAVLAGDDYPDEVRIEQADVQAATDAIIAGWYDCPNRRSGPCDRSCDLSEITGCKALVDAIAKAIATARTLGK